MKPSISPQTPTERHTVTPTIMNSTPQELHEIVGNYMGLLEDYEQEAGERGIDEKPIVECWNYLEVWYHNILNDVFPNETHRNRIRQTVKEAMKLASVLGLETKGGRHA